MTFADVQDKQNLETKRNNNRIYQWRIKGPMLVRRFYFLGGNTLLAKDQQIRDDVDK